MLRRTLDQEDPDQRAALHEETAAETADWYRLLAHQLQRWTTRGILSRGASEDAADRAYGELLVDEWLRTVPKVSHETFLAVLEGPCPICGAPPNDTLLSLGAVPGADCPSCEGRLHVRSGLLFGWDLGHCTPCRRWYQRFVRCVRCRLWVCLAMPE